MFEVHNITDVFGPPRKILVKKVPLRPGAILPMNDLGRHLERSLNSPQESGLLLVREGETLPDWVLDHRVAVSVAASVAVEVVVEIPTPLKVPSVIIDSEEYEKVEEELELSIPEPPEPPKVEEVDLSDIMDGMSFSQLKELLEKVTEERYSGRRSSKTVRSKLLKLELELVLAALE